MPKAVTGICSQDVINRFQDVVYVDNGNGAGGNVVHVAGCSGGWLLVNPSRSGRGIVDPPADCYETETIA